LIQTLEAQKASDFFGLDHKGLTNVVLYARKASDFLDKDLNNILGEFFRSS